MKRMKTLLTVLVSFVMLLVFSNTAFAANSVTVTVPSEMLKNHTFVAYQIFTGSKDTENGPLVDVQWGSGINDSAFLAALKNDTSIGNFSNCSTAADVAKVLGEVTSNSDVANAIAKLALANIKANGTPLSTETNELASGYYLIVDATNVDGKDDATNAALLQVTSNITINQKTDKPSVEKKVKENAKYNEDGGYGTSYNDVADYNIGDKVPFKLIGSIPNMTHYETYSYTFHDSFSAGLTFNNDVKVYLSTDKAGTNKVEVTPNFKTTSESDKFTVNCANLKTIENISNYKYILVEYTATLNENAVIGLDGNPNTVWLTYSNKPDQSGEGQPEKGETPKDTVIVFTYELDTTKVDGENPDTKLKDAEFKLKNADNKWVQVNTNGKVTGWADTEKDGTTLKSDKNGLFKVIGLDAGTYYLKETKAPSDYNQLANEIKLTITATTNNGQTWTDADAKKALTNLEVAVGEATATPGNLNEGTVNVTIENNKGTVLPATGGIGTTMFYTIGGLLMLATAILLITKRRMNAK